MSKINTALSNLLRDEEGATAAEYSVMLVLILLAAFATIAVLGVQVEAAFNKFVALFKP